MNSDNLLYFKDFYIEVFNKMLISSEIYVMKKRKKMYMIFNLTQNKKVCINMLFFSTNDSSFVYLINIKFKLYLICRR